MEQKSEMEDPRQTAPTDEENQLQTAFPEQSIELLQRYNNLLQLIVETDPVGLAVLLGPELVFQFVNPAYHALIPHPELDPVGLSYDQVWPLAENFRGNWLMRRILATGKPFHMDRYVQQYPDGSIHYFSMDLRRFIWENEPAILIVTLDITRMEEAHLRAEQAAAVARLRAAEAEEGKRILEALMEHIPQGITIVTAPDFQVRMVSKYGRELAGLQREQTEGIPFDKHLENLHLLDPDEESRVPRCDLPLARAIDLGEVTRNAEFILARPDGQKISLLSHAGPIRDEKGEVVGGVVAWQDITERKRAEQALQTYARKLERSNRDLQDFAFIASHDLQEPLRKVQSFGDRLAERYQLVLDAEGLDFLNRMRNAAVRMQKMVNDLLAYSRVMTRPEPFVEVDLNKVVEQAVSDLELRIESSVAQIEIGELPIIQADGIQMQQLFQNLLGNAIKFHQPGFPPVIKIFCRTKPLLQSKEQAYVEVVVQDEGIGFDEKYLDRIFQPFQRLHGQGKFDGSGIGLAVCRKIAERHSGAITAHSKPGQGASFIVKLPVHQKEEVLK